MESLREVLMYRDQLTQDQADDVIREAQLAVREGEDPEEVLKELGLEPDYVIDLFD